MPLEQGHTESGFCSMERVCRADNATTNDRYIIEFSHGEQ